MRCVAKVCRNNGITTFFTDELGAISKDPFPVGHIRAGDIGRESVPRADDRGRDHERVFRAGQPDGEV